MAGINRFYPLAYNDEILRLFADVSNVNTIVTGTLTTLTTLFLMVGFIYRQQNAYYLEFDNQLQELNSNQQQYLEELSETVTTMSKVLGAILLVSDSLNYTINDILNEQELISPPVQHLPDDIETITNNQRDLIKAIEEIDIETIVLRTIRTTKFDLNCPSISGTGFDALACEYDPLGVGPINCDGLEFEELNCEVATLVPEDPE